MTGFGPVSVPPADRPAAALDLSLLRHFESVVNLDPKVADCAFQLDVPEQQLHDPKVLRAAVDQRGLGAPHRVRPVVGAVEPELLDPRFHNSSVLASRQMSRRSKPARKQWVLRSQPGVSDPSPDRISGLLRDLELRRTLGLLLQNNRPGCDATPVADLSDAQLDQVTGSKLALRSSRGKRSPRSPVIV